jgi:hypothetical protein
MLTQRLVADQNTMDGTLTITCDPGNLAQLLDLQKELAFRAEVHTEASVITTVQIPVMDG